MGEYAARKLRQRGYEIHLGTPMKEVREDGVVIGDGEFIPSRTVIWTGGVQPSPVVRRVGDRGRQGRTRGHRSRPWRRAARASGRSATARCIPNVEHDGELPRADRPERGARGEAAGPQHRRRASTAGRSEVEPFRYRTIGHAGQHRAPHRRRRRVRDQGPRLDRLVHVARLLLEPRAGHRRQGARRRSTGSSTRCSASDPVQLKVDYAAGRRRWGHRARGGRPPRRTDPRA